MFTAPVPVTVPPGSFPATRHSGQLNCNYGDFDFRARLPMTAINFMLNGESCEIDSPGSAPLLHVLRNDLCLGSPQFGCGLAQCGACSVLVDGKKSARVCCL